MTDYAKRSHERVLYFSYVHTYELRIASIFFVVFCRLLECLFLATPIYISRDISILAGNLTGPKGRAGVGGRRREGGESITESAVKSMTPVLAFLVSLAFVRVQPSCFPPPARRYLRSQCTLYTLSQRTS